MKKITIFTCRMLLLATLLYQAVVCTPGGSLLAAEFECQESDQFMYDGAGQPRLDISSCTYYTDDHEVVQASIYALQWNGLDQPYYWYPEENSYYWVATLPSLAGQDAHYEIEGMYPHARHTSIQSHSVDGDRVDNIFDYQILPQAGSYNPFLLEANYSGKNQYFNIKAYALQNPLAVGDGNLALKSDAEDEDAEDGNNAEYLLLLRVYDFNERALQKGVPEPPAIYYVLDSEQTPHYETVDEIYEMSSGVDSGKAKFIELLGSAQGYFAPVAAHMAELGIGLAQTGTDPPLWFIGYDYMAGLLPAFEQYPGMQDYITENLVGSADQMFQNEALAYYGAYVNQNIQDVMVTRVKVPTVANTNPECDAEEPGCLTTQARYWSFCMNNTLLMSVTSCKQDSEFDVDDDGYLTVAVSADRLLNPDTKNPHDTFANWLPVEAPLSVLFYRQLLPSDHFSESAYFYCKDDSGQNICADDPLAFNNYEALEAQGQEYYPRSVSCSRQQFEKDTCRAKFIQEYGPGGWWYAD